MDTKINTNGGRERHGVCHGVWLGNGGARFTIGVFSLNVVRRIFMKHVFNVQGMTCEHCEKPCHVPFGSLTVQPLLKLTVSPTRSRLIRIRIRRH